MPPQDSLGSFANVLANNGYAVEAFELRSTGASLLAETPYALVLCITSSWKEASDKADQAQATLTRLSAEHPSPRSWDLYVVLVIDDEDNPLLREQLESDTRYARKLVVCVDGRLDSAERALLPLLPLRDTTQLEPINMASDVMAELINLGIDERIAAAALASFSAHGAVELP